MTTNLTKDQLARLIYVRMEQIDSAFGGVAWDDAPEHHQTIYLEAAEAILAASSAAKADPEIRCAGCGGPARIRCESCDSDPFS